MNKTHLTSLATYSLAALALITTCDSALAKRKDSKAQVIRGFITQLSATSVIVGDQTIAITTGTKFEDFVGGATTIEALAVGDCVKIKVRPAQTTLTAREVELEDRCPSSSATPRPTPSGTATPKPESTCRSTPIPTATRTGTPTADDSKRHKSEGQDDSGRHGRGGR